MRILPPSLFYAAIILTFICHYYIHIGLAVFYPYILLGIPIILIGIAINVWAWMLFRKHGTTTHPFKKPTRFVREGPYKLSRHPQYYGMASILLGIAVLLGSFSAFIPAILFMIIMEIFFIPMEERTMHKHFAEYAEYKKKTGKV